MFAPWYLNTVTQELGIKFSANSLASKYSLFTLNSLLDMPQITNSIALEC